MLPTTSPGKHERDEARDTGMTLPTIGEDAFLPKLLDHLHGAIHGTQHDEQTKHIDDPTLERWRFDPSIFSAILLDRIVGGSGVLVDVDVYGWSAQKGRIALDKVARHVQAITNGAFGLRTSHIALSAQNTADELVQQLLWSDAAQDSKQSVPNVFILTGLERCKSAVWVKLVDILIKQYIQLRGWKTDPSLMDFALDEADEGRVRLPAGFTVVWVREEALADQTPGYLVDRFSVNASVHPDDIPLVPSLPLRPVIPPLMLENLSTLIPYMHVHPPLQIHSSNLLSAVTAHPRLSNSVTGRAFTLFSRLIQAHRVLSASFYLPDGWEEGLERRRRIQRGEDVGAYSYSDAASTSMTESTGGRGLSGGKGGVGMWDVFSGAEPSVLDLDLHRSCRGQGQGRSEGQHLAEGRERDGEEEGEDPYATPANVEGIFWTALRHRVKLREEQDEVMWLLKTTGCDLIALDGAEEEAKDGQEGAEDAGAKARRRAREVDRILSEILRSV